MLLNGISKDTICLISTFLDPQSLRSFGSTNKKYNSIIFKDASCINMIWARHLNISERLLPEKITKKSAKERVFEILKFYSDSKQISSGSGENNHAIRWIDRFTKENDNKYGVAVHVQRQFDDWFTDSEKSFIQKLDNLMKSCEFHEACLLDLEHHFNDDGLKFLDKNHAFLINYSILFKKISFKKLILSLSKYSFFKADQIIDIFGLSQDQIKKILADFFGTTAILLSNSNVLWLLVKRLHPSNQREILERFVKLEFQDSKNSFILENIFFREADVKFEFGTDILEMGLRNFLVDKAFINSFYKNTSLTISQIIAWAENCEFLFDTGSARPKAFLFKVLIKKYLKSNDQNPEDAKKLLKLLIKRNEASEKLIKHLSLNPPISQEGIKELITDIITNLNLSNSGKMNVLSLLLECANSNEQKPFFILPAEYEVYTQKLESYCKYWESYKNSKEIIFDQRPFAECKEQVIQLLSKYVRN